MSISHWTRLPRLPLAVLVAASVAALLSWTVYAQTAGPDELILELDEAPPVTAGERGPANVESALHQLATAYEGNRSGAYALAQSMDVDMSNGKAVVIVEAAPESVTQVREAIESLGGTILRSRAELLKARLPMPTVEALAVVDGVVLIRRPATPVPATVTSQGVAIAGADKWHSAGFKGSGVKVAIIDLGFKGHTSLLGTELPASVTVRSFRIDNDIEANSDHGTEVAQIVHDMAPEAELYLVNFGDELDLDAAVKWLIAQGVHVINHSVGWSNAGPGDGTGFINNIVALAETGVSFG